MSKFEYKVVPAPKAGLKAKGIKSSEDRFAHALQSVMNEFGTDGWEYQRTDTLPCEERSGLTRRVTTFQNMLVFRRAIEVPVAVAVETATPAKQRVAETIARVVEAPKVAPKPLAADPARIEPQVAAE